MGLANCEGCSAAMAPEMIPMMIQQGYAAIAIAFDAWGLANLVHGGIKQARGFAIQAAEAANETKATNGTKVANGTTILNGKATKEENGSVVVPVETKN